MAFALVYGGIGAFALVMFGWRAVVALRGPRSAARWAVAVAILCAAIGFEAAVPRTYTWLGRVTGSPNIATLIVYGAITAAVLAQVVWISHLVGAPQRTRRVVAAAIVTLIAMTGLFAVAPVHDAVHATDFDATYAKEPLAVAFLAIYLAAYSGGLIRIVLASRAWLPDLEQLPGLRTGMRLLGVGSAIAVLYAAGKVAAIVGAWSGLDTHRLNVDIAPAFASMGAAVMLVGYLLPGLLAWWRTGQDRRRQLRRLQPLWLELRAVAPELAVDRRLAGTRARLYRRVIEIRDWLVRLQPYLSDESAAAGHELAELVAGEGDRAAVVEAVRIGAALRARAAGLRGSGGTFAESATPGLAGEIVWLADVSEAYARFVGPEDSLLSTPGR